MSIRDQFRNKNNAGEGFDPLPENDDATADGVEALEAELGPCVQTADGVSAFARGDGNFTLVGDANGPWAVTVERLED